MNFLEHAAKSGVLEPAGIPTPFGRVCRTPEEASATFRRSWSLRGEGASADRKTG